MRRGGLKITKKKKLKTKKTEDMFLSEMELRLSSSSSELERLFAASSSSSSSELERVFAAIQSAVEDAASSASEWLVKKDAAAEKIVVRRRRRREENSRRRETTPLPDFSVSFEGDVKPKILQLNCGNDADAATADSAAPVKTESPDVKSETDDAGSWRNSGRRVPATLDGDDDDENYEITINEIDDDDDDDQTKCQKNPNVIERIRKLRSLKRKASTLTNNKVHRKYPKIEANSAGQFVCPMNGCGTDFCTYNRLILHMKEDHELFLHKCDHCDKGFLSSSRLALHSDSAHSSPLGDFSCSAPPCSRRFSSEENLRRHLRLEHAPGATQRCPHCDEEFERLRQRNRHVIAAHAHLVFGCLVCRVRFFARETELVHHIESEHGGEGLMRCRHCDKFKAVYPSTLTYHLESHHPDLVSIPSPFFCPVPTCRLPFSSPAFVDKHVRIHRKPKEKDQLNPAPKSTPPKKRRAERTTPPDAVCPRCGVAAPNLEEHLRKFHAARSVCEECGKTFGGPGTLRRHRLLKHVERPFPCPHCDKTLTRLNSLKKHLKTVHGGRRESFPCADCGKTYLTKMNATLHQLAVHRGISWPCCVCGKEFMSAGVRNRHEREVHGRKPILDPSDC